MLAVGRGHCAKLLPHAGHVHHVPVLNHLAVADAEQVEHIEGDVVPSRWDADELSLVRPRERLQRRDPISLSDLLFDLDGEVGKGLPDVLEEFEAILLVPGLAGTRRAVDEVIRRKFFADSNL